MSSDDLTVDQFAALLRTGRDTIARAIRAGELRANRTDGGQYQIPRESAIAYLNANTITPDGQEPTPVTADLPQTMSLDEVADKTGLPIAWLREGCRRKRLVHLKPGKSPRMTPNHVEAAIAAATVDTVVTDEVQAERERRQQRGRNRRAA
jgi:excisionase family DNA binding protein